MQGMGVGCLSDGPSGDGELSGAVQPTLCRSQARRGSVSGAGRQLFCYFLPLLCSDMPSCRGLS